MMFRLLNTTTLFITLTFIFFGGVPASLNAQSRVVDSLSAILKTARIDTVKIKLLSELAEVCEVNDMLEYVEPSMKLCKQAVAEKRKPVRFYLKYLGNAINNLGYYNSKKGNPEKALQYYQQALEIFRKLDDKQAMAYLLNNVGFIYNNRGDVARSLQYYFENLKIQEEIRDTFGIAYSMNNISTVYTGQRNYSKALQYGENSYKLYERMRYTEGMAMALNNIGLTYFYQENMPMALDYYEKALEKYRSIHEGFGMSSMLNTIGIVYSKLGDTNKALAYLSESLSIAEEHHYKDVITHCLSSIADVYIKAGQPQKAAPYALRSIKMARELGSPREIQGAAQSLKQIYLAQNNYKTAYEMYQLETQMRDSLVNETNKKELVSKELEYEYEKKELQSKLKQEQNLSDLKLENQRKHARKNMLVYGLLFLAIVLGLSMFYVFKFFKQKNIINANKNNELKQKLLLSQMNPHFIFNSVDNIQSLIMQKQDKEAVNYLTKFSKLTRQILENSTENYISLNEELAMTDNYLNIQQLLYNNKFSYTISVEESIETEAVLLPPMLTQPFIENAIKHGLKNKAQDGTIAVRFYMKEQSLFFEVKDNGSGLGVKNVAEGHKSLSTQIVNERLNHNSAGKKIQVITQNILENNTIKGVSVMFEIPYLYEN